MRKHEQKVCLVCGKLETDDERFTRGLCIADYHVFTRLKRSAIAKEIDVEAWEADLVEKGVLLPDGRAKTNVFAESLEKFIVAKQEQLAVAESREDEYAESMRDATDTTKPPAKKRQAKAKASPRVASPKANRKRKNA